MANETPGGQDPKFERRVVRWLLDSNPSIRWQVMRDLAEDPDEPVAAERMTGMRARAVAGFASVRGGFYPRIYLLADASPSVPQYHRRQTLGRESGDGRPERASTALELAESRATPSGVLIQAYRPTGHLRYGKAATDMKHVR
jgi:hypothetical protein